MPYHNFQSKDALGRKKSENGCAYSYKKYRMAPFSLAVWKLVVAVRLKVASLVCYAGPRGVLSLEKGTDCGPSAAELWLSQANNAKKGGLCSHYG